MELSTGVVADARLEAPAETPPGDSESAFPRWLLAVAALVVVAGVALRFLTRSDLWLDEALTVNIAKLPLSELKEALRHDGAPPAYYVLLHGWMSLFGSGDFAVRALPGLLSVATLPFAWFAGRRLGDPAPPGPLRSDSPRRHLLAALTVLVFAASPFAIRYATEARPYAAVIFLVTVGYLAFRRALEQPSVGRLALVALITASLLYTHYWSLYLLVALFVFLAWRGWRASAGSERRTAWSVAASLVVGALAFLPWVPTFLYQSAHTATPWGEGRSPVSSLRQTVDQFANGASIYHGPADPLGLLMVLLVALALFGVARGAWRVDLDLRTRPPIRREALIAFAALLLGTTAAWVTDGAYDARYASVVFPLVALVIAFGFTVFGSRVVMLWVLALFLGIGLVGGVYSALDNRTQAKEFADVILAEAKPGDVVAYCPDQLGPSVSRLLSARTDLEQLTFPSGGAPERVDWVDYHDRIDHTPPAKFADKVLRRAGAGSTIWYVYSTAYFGVEGKCEAVGALLQSARPGARSRVLPDTAYFESGGLLQFPS